MNTETYDGCSEILKEFAKLGHLLYSSSTYIFILYSRELVNSDLSHWTWLESWSKFTFGPVFKHSTYYLILG